MSEPLWIYLSAESALMATAVEEAAVAFEIQGFAIRMRPAGGSAAEVSDSMTQAYAWVYVGSDFPASGIDDPQVPLSVLQSETQEAACLELAIIHFVPVSQDSPPVAPEGLPHVSGRWQYGFAAGDQVDPLFQVNH